MFESMSKLLYPIYYCHKIPIAPTIKLNAGDVIQFLVAHNERHLKQARRAVDMVLKSSNLVQ